MYEYIRGKLIEARTHCLILETQGIGYKIFVPLHFEKKMPICGEEIFLYVSWVIREEAHTLYGFLRREERDLFEILISLSGIGPKTGMGILGHLSIEELHGAVEKKDPLPLQKVPGIGKKTAERLLIDLRGKLQHIDLSALSPLSSEKTRDALQALIRLGYTQSAAENAIQQALSHLSESYDLSTLLATALKFHR